MWNHGKLNVSIGRIRPVYLTIGKGWAQNHGMQVQVAIGKEKGKTIWRSAEATIREGNAWVALPYPYAPAIFKCWRKAPNKRGKRADQG